MNTKRVVIVLLFLAVAFFSLYCTGDLLRKNDQAVILSGALDLAGGRFTEPADYYQWGKTYVTYGWCALVNKTAQKLDLQVSPIAVSNFSMALCYWLGLGSFLWVARKKLRVTPLLCYLLTPAVLLNTLYVNSTLMSSAFFWFAQACVFLSAGRLADGSKKSFVHVWLWMPLSCLFMFLAVAARADSILLLPFALWTLVHLHAARRPEGRGLLHAPVVIHSLLLSLSAAMALLAGLQMDGGSVHLAPFFHTKVATGYIVFGWGAAGLLYIAYAISLCRQALRETRAVGRFTMLAGVAAFLLPFIFYLFQLHSPRYFWRASELMLLVSCISASLTMPIFGGRHAMKWQKRALAATGVAVVIPLLVGVNIDELGRPRLSVRESSRYPTGDGHYAMGSYLAFMKQMAKAHRQPLDHNQLVWRAISRVEWPHNTESIKVLWTPMYGYWKLKSSLEKKECSFIFSKALDRERDVFTETRSLMRMDPKTPIENMAWILDQPAEVITDGGGGIHVIRFISGDSTWSDAYRLFNRLCNGNEYRLNVGYEKWRPGFACFAYSRTFFPGALLDVQTGIYFRKARPEDIGAQKELSYSMARTVWPVWMSIQPFRAEN